MQNTIRARNKGGKAARSTQAKTATPLPEPGIDTGSYQGQTSICMCIFDYKADGMLAGCDITSDQWSKIASEAKARGIAVGTLLASVVENLTSAPAEFALPKKHSHPSCLAIYDRLGKGLVSKIPLTETEFESLLIAGHAPDSHLRGMSTGTIVADAIREKLIGKKTSRVENSRAEFDLESAAQNALCLIDLLLNKAIAEAGDRTFAHSQFFDEITALICGIQNLSHKVTTELLAGLNTYSATKNEVTS